MIFLSILFLICPLVFGTSINVKVVGVLDSIVKKMDHVQLDNDGYNAVLTTSYDVFNSGSIAYAARIRLDIFNGSEEITSIWSREYRLNPGQRDTIDLYWYEPSEANLNVKSILYRAYDVVDLENMTWIFEGIQSSGNNYGVNDGYGSERNNELYLDESVVDDTKRRTVKW